MAKVTKSQIADRAKEIIKDRPSAGRRVIARELRAEFGKALRDAEILRLQREIYPRPYQHVEAKRTVRLRKEGFLPFEVKELKTRAFATTGFMVKERRERSKERNNFIADLRERGYTKHEAEKEYRDSINDKYLDAEWVLEDGKPDPWQMFRDVRGKAIKSRIDFIADYKRQGFSEEEAGEEADKRGYWKETPRYLRSHRKGRNKLDKGKIKEQRARYKQRIKEQRAKKNQRKKGK